MKFFPPVSRRAYIVGSTLMIILLIFGYYLLVYLPRQEAGLITHRGRALNRITSNFIEKYEVRKKVQDNSKDPTFDIQIDHEFMHNILLRDIFDEYLLYKNNQLIFHTSSGEVFVPKAAGAKDNPAEQTTYDTLTADKLFPGITEAKLGFIDYKLFSTSFKIKNSRIVQPDPLSNTSADTTRVATQKPTTWTLYALVRADKFEAEKRSVSPFLVVNLSVILLLIVFASPFLKQVFMSGIEQINQHDVVFITTSFLLSTAVIILSLLTLDSYFVDTKNATDRHLSALSDTIKLSFEKEIFQMNRLLNTFDQAGTVLSEQLGSGDTCELQYGITNNINVFEDNTLKSKTESYPFFKNIYWMDQQGVSRLWYLGKGREKCPAIDTIHLGTRSYFKNIHANQGWQAEGIDTPFMLESIYSWLTTENLGVFSKPSSVKIKPFRTDTLTASVVGVSSVLYSVIDPILPPGFGFCIIDQAGNVQFHSNKNKNLRENFLVECNNPSALRAALQSNITAYAETGYHNLDHRVYIQPLTTLPWYLITFHEQSQSTSPYAQIILYTFIGIMVLGLTGGLQSLLVFIFCTRSGKLRRAYFPFEWLRPSTGKNAKYLLIIVLIMLYSLINCIYNIYFCHSIIHTLSSFQFTMMLAYVFAFAVLMPEKDERFPDKLYNRYWLVIITIVFLSLLTLLLSIHLSSDGSGTLSAQQKTHIFLWVILFFLGSIFFLLQYFIFHKDKVLNPALQAIFTKTQDWHYQPYLLMLYGYLLMNGVLSTLFIFQKSYEQEMQIWKRSALYQLATHLEKREGEIEQQYNKNNSNDRGVATGKKMQGLHFHAAGFDTLDKRHISYACETTMDSPTLYFENLLFQTRLYFSSLMEEVSGFTFRRGNAGKKWKTGQNDSLLFLDYTRSDLRQQPVMLSSPIPKYYLWDPRFEWGNAFFTFTGILFLFGVYKSLRFVVTRIYGLNLFNGKILMPDNSYLKECIEEGNRNLMIIALPFSGIDTLLAEHANAAQPFSLMGLHTDEDFKEIRTQARGSSSKIVALTQFGYQFQNMEVSLQKLKLLERLRSSQKTIFIVSDVVPAQIFEVYEDMNKNSTEYEKKLYYENLISRWRELLSGFIKSYYFTVKDKPTEKPKEDGTLGELIDYEQDAFPEYFMKFCPSLKENFKNELENRNRAIKEEVVLKIQTLAQPFYLSLWNTCSKEERYLLYDLATDNFVNTKNKEGLAQLLKKGLIYYDESLYVMNESFRNFILSTAKKSEALELEREMNKKGTWRIMQVVIAILALSLIVFVSFAQETLLNNFMAILTSLAAITPFLLKLSGLFSSNLISSKEG